jgi:tetratricopeptide (TPR) repeat protein
VLVGLLVAVGGLALYAPFFDSFYAMVGGIGVVNNFTTLRDYAIVYGVFLAVLLPLALGAIIRSWQLAVGSWQFKQRPLLIVGVISGLLILTAFMLPDVGLRLALAALLLGLAILFFQRRIGTPAWFTLLLVTTGVGVSLGMEIVYIRDHLAGGDWFRMNTVFKFGMQVWVVFALAAAAGLPLVLQGVKRLMARRIDPGVLQPAYGLVLVALVALAAIYPLVGTLSRVANRFPDAPAPTLNGLAFMRNATFDYNCDFGGCEPGQTNVLIDLRGDAAAIDWLNSNVRGTPVVLQSNLFFYRAYGIRVAANTGLPTVVSALHVNEQRDPFLASVRDQDVETLYRSSDREQTLRLLAKYKVNYVYVGGVERAVYNQAGLDKFAAMNGIYMDEIYNRDDVQIYRVRPLPAMYSAPERVAFAPDPPPALLNWQDDGQTEPLTRPRPGVRPDNQPADLTELEAAVAQEPTNGPLVFGLAERYRNLSRFDDAARVLAPAARANPSDIGLFHLWGDILTQAGRLDEAEQVYTTVARNNPSAGNWNKLGAALLTWGELDKAELALTQALALDGTAPEPYFHLGQLYQQRGDNDNAVKNLETYLQLAPEGQFSPDARELLQQLQP